jgi:NAD(P)-dependent dehydrogenase (short-subunit alcohol dehydrogenase family)
MKPEPGPVGGLKLKLKDRVAVVTGGGRGIGRSICLAMAREGAKIVSASNVETEVQAVSEEVSAGGGRAVPVPCDVTDSDSVRGLLAQTVGSFGKVDILVNNAGVVGERFFVSEYDDDTWHKVLNVNLNGAYRCSKAFLPQIMQSPFGRVINIASISGKQASPTNAAYCASKHAIIGLTRTIAAELGLLGLTRVTANAICPGVVNTDMLTGPGMILDEIVRILGVSREAALEERVKSMSLQKKVLETEEIAAMAVYLASDDARSITGQAINVCGGSVFH